MPILQISFGALLTVVLVIILYKRGKRKQNFNHADSDYYGNYNGDRSVRVRPSPGMDEIRESVKNRQITGDYEIVEKATGFRYHAWRVPDDILDAYRLYHMTKGRVKVHGLPGDIAPPMMYFSQDKTNIAMQPGQVLIYHPPTDRFQVLNWMNDREKYHLEI